KVFALMDSPMREIHKLALAADGSIYALGLSSQASSEKVSTASTSPTTTSLDTGGTVTVITSFDDDSTTSTASSSSISSTSTQSHTTDSSGSKAVLYRITQDGGNDAIWSSREAVAFGLTIGKNGEVLVGTGLKGRIYSVDV